MTYYLKSLAVRITATAIALLICAAAALLLNRLMVYFDAGIKTTVLYVLPAVEDSQTPKNLSRVSF